MANIKNPVIWVYGKLGLQIPVTGLLGSDYRVVNPSLDAYYSEFGFAFPLTVEMISFRQLMLGHIPKYPEAVKRCAQSSKWLWITPEEHLLIITAFTEKGVINIETFAPPFQMNSLGVIAEDDSNPFQELVGILHTHQSDPITTINTYCENNEVGNGLKFVWVDYEDILAVIRKTTDDIKARLKQYVEELGNESESEGDSSDSGSTESSG